MLLAKNKILSFGLLFSMLLAICPTSLMANFVGPDYSEITDLRNAYDAKINQKIRIIGHIKYRIRSDLFLVENKNGDTIKMRVPLKAWPIYRNVRPTSRVFIRGKIKFLESEKIILAKKIDVIKNNVSKKDVYKYFEYEY